MGDFPEGADLFFLSLRRKDALLHTQLKQVLQMGGLGIVTACLPLTDGTAGDPQQSSQAGLCQANTAAQLEHTLPKDVVALTIGVPRHRRAPCFPRDPAALYEECEPTGNKHGSFWQLTSPGPPATL